MTPGVVTNADWDGLLRTIGREDLGTHPAFSRVEWRIVHNDEIDRIVGEWTSRFTAREVIERLRAADVPCGVVRTAREAIEWPQLKARDMVQELRRPDGSAAGVAAAGMPLKFSRSFAAHNEPAPVPGGHTAAVLERFLGMDADEVARYRAEGIL